MKKIFILMVWALCFINPAFAGAYNNITEAVYSPQTQSWSVCKVNEDDIILNKKTAEGTFNYSGFYYEDGTLAAAVNSNFEFIKDGMLIIVDNIGLKYYKLIYKNGGFYDVLLSDEELQKVFPGVEIVKISKFKDGMIILRKNCLKSKKILLVDDTDEIYYHFECKRKSAQDKCIKGLLTFRSIGKCKINRYGIHNQRLKIYIR